MKEEYLSAAVQFIITDTPYLGLVEEYYLCLDGDTVGRRSVYYAQVAGTEKRELERPRNRSGGEGEGVYVRFQLTEFFFGAYTEFLLFVDYKKSQVLEFKSGSEYFVGTNENINLTRCKLIINPFSINICRAVAKTASSRSS